MVQFRVTAASKFKPVDFGMRVWEHSRDTPTELLPSSPHLASALAVGSGFGIADAVLARSRGILVF